VAAIVDFATAMMFQRRDPKRLDKSVHELSRGVVVLLERSARNRSCWMSWTMGQDDGAGLVRYANSSVNLRVLLLTG
jgi:hypothetical protein